LSKVRVGVVGVGHLGGIHARVYSELENAALVGVTDTDEKRGREVAARYNTRYFEQPADLLKELDAVSIAVPARRHCDLAKEALSHGVHCLVEKPIACTVREADSMLGLAREKGKKLFVGHVERFSPPMVALKDRIADPLFMECHRLAGFNPRGTDVDVVLDLMIHDIDLLLWLVRSKPEKIDAVGMPVLTQHEDIANARVEFESGCIANLTASRVSKSSVRKMRIFQKSEYLSIDTPGKSVEICRRCLDERGVPRVEREGVQVDGEEPLKAELKAFLQETSKGIQTSLATGEDGRNALVVASRILELIRERRARLESE
jgi:predicted dehydrogenase